MTKNEFVDRVAADSGLSKKDAGAAVDSVIKSIEAAPERGIVMQDCDLLAGKALGENLGRQLALLIVPSADAEDPRQAAIREPGAV